MDEKNSKERNYVIRKMALPHCARGPGGCQRCVLAEKNVKIYLLEVYSDTGTFARPVIEINIRGKKIYQVYDVIKGFDTRKQAGEYAKENKLTLIEEEK